MKAREVARKDWSRFCEKLTAHRGAMVTVERVGSDGGREALAENVPLHGVLWEEKPGGCSDELVIEAGPAGERPAQHRIIEPIHIRLKDGQHNDRYNHVQIVAESGEIDLTLNPGLLPTEV